MFRLRRARSKALPCFYKQKKTKTIVSFYKGKPDHQAKVDELAKKTKDENPGMRVVTEKRFKAMIRTGDQMFRSLTLKRVQQQEFTKLKEDLKVLEIRKESLSITD